MLLRPRTSTSSRSRCGSGTRAPDRPRSICTPTTSSNSRRSNAPPRPAPPRQIPSARHAPRIPGTALARTPSQQGAAAGRCSGCSINATLLGFRFSDANRARQRRRRNARQDANAGLSAAASPEVGCVLAADASSGRGWQRGSAILMPAVRLNTSFPETLSATVLGAACSVVVMQSCDSRGCWLGRSLRSEVSAHS
jgi:hypothetical protein